MYCMLGIGIGLFIYGSLWNLYILANLTHIFLSFLISPNELWLFKVSVSILDSCPTADRRQSHSASFGTMFTWERKTEPSSHPVLQHVPCFNREKKTPSKLRNWMKNIHGWFFHTVLLHTTCHPTKRIVFQHLHCYDGDAAHKWQRLTKRANGVFMSCNEKPPFSIRTIR